MVGYISFHPTRKPFSSKPSQSAQMAHISRASPIPLSTKYWVVLFNLHEPIERRLDPLPIPVNGGDYIRVGDRWGPNSMISILEIAILVDKIVLRCYIGIVNLRKLFSHCEIIGAKNIFAHYFSGFLVFTTSIRMP
jgi:hypothetical protein